MTFEEEFRTFSESRSYVHPNREKDFFLVCAGCHKWSWPIVEDAAVTGWLGGKYLDHLRKVNWDIGMIVGAVVFNHTREGFEWSTVCDILDVGGRNGMSEGIFSFYEARYPLGANKFWTPPGARGVKRIAQDLAKATLWVEALSFLLSKDYDERLVA